MGKTKTKIKNITISLLLIFITFPLIIPPLASASNSNQWNIVITNLDGTTLNLSYDDILVMPKTVVSADLLCYGNLVSSGSWGGVRLSDLINIAIIDPSVVSVDFTAQDGYSVSIPINTAIRTDVIVAYDLEGSQLNEVYRLVVPDANGDIWISAITTIKMSISSADQIQSGTSGQIIINQYQAIINTTTPAPLQQPPQGETQPIVPSNKTDNEPVTTPTINTIPQADKKITEQINSIPQIEYILILFGVIVLVSLVGFVFISRKKPKKLT